MPLGCFSDGVAGKGERPGTRLQVIAIRACPGATEAQGGAFQKQDREGHSVGISDFCCLAKTKLTLLKPPCILCLMGVVI